MKNDIRCIQRYNNYRKAFSNLTEAIEITKERKLSKLEKQGLIQVFEHTYELAWNTVRDFYISKGETEIHGSRDAFRMAFERGLIESGTQLLESVRSRQLTSHTYNEETADEIYNDIINKYYSAYRELYESFEKEKGKEEDSCTD